jgi:hypothetical protein
MINLEEVATKTALFKLDMEGNVFVIIQRKSINAKIFVNYIKFLMDVNNIVIFL